MHIPRGPQQLQPRRSSGHSRAAAGRVGSEGLQLSGLEGICWDLRNRPGWARGEPTAGQPAAWHLVTQRGDKPSPGQPAALLSQQGSRAFRLRRRQHREWSGAQAGGSRTSCCRQEELEGRGQVQLRTTGLSLCQGTSRDPGGRRRSAWDTGLIPCLQQPEGARLVLVTREAAEKAANLHPVPGGPVSLWYFFSCSCHGPSVCAVLQACCGDESAGESSSRSSWGSF